MRVRVLLLADNLYFDSNSHFLNFEGLAMSGLAFSVAPSVQTWPIFRIGAHYA